MTTSPEFRGLYDALAVIDREGFGADVDADSVIEDAARARLAELAVRDHLATDEYDDHLFVPPAPDHPDHLDNGGQHLCQWGAPDNTCGDAADSQNHRHDITVITTDLEEDA